MCSKSVKYVQHQQICSKSANMFKISQIIFRLFQVQWWRHKQVWWGDLGIVIIWPIDSGGSGEADGGGGVGGVDLDGAAGFDGALHLNHRPFDSPAPCGTSKQPNSTNWNYLPGFIGKKIDVLSSEYYYLAILLCSYCIYRAFWACFYKVHKRPLTPCPPPC